ncbi:MAG TPA: malectin [Candidatus Saccharimonadales bacterium]|nr:malectin [Candidatus Saccharimonadales bacterium]
MRIKSIIVPTLTADNLIATSQQSHRALSKATIVGRQTWIKFMLNTNRPMQKWAGRFIVMLAVALITGCQSAKENASANVNSSIAAAPDQSSPLMPHPITPESVPPIAVTPPVRINCGATEKLTDSEGHVWLPDEGYADGNPYEVDDAQVTNTKDPEIFRTERYSMASYRFGVPNGKYTVKLLFAEVYSGITGPGDRVFSFDVQGHEFRDFDIWVKAGGPDKAYVQSVDVDVTNGVLEITFAPDVQNPKICGIEILPQS